MSRFMTDADYASYIKDRRLSMILEGDLTKLLPPEEVGVQAVTDALFERYDVNTIFAQTGTARSATVMSWIRAIALYEIWGGIDDKLIPQRTIDNYKECKDTLRLLQKGDISVPLPRIKECGTSGPVKTKFRWGSEPKNGADFLIKGGRRNRGGW